MWRSVSVTEFVRNFADLINRVAYRREHLRLMRGGRVLAEVRPAPEGARLGDLPQLLANLPHLGEAEAGGFGQELERARKQLNRKPVRDAWDS